MKGLALFCVLISSVFTNCDYMGLQRAFDENYYNIYGDYEYNDNQLRYGKDDKVNIEVFYEVFCPHCRTFDTQQLLPVIEKLGDYVNIHTYPYGNAKTIEKDGKIDFICQHGPTECYGNKLHACALDNIKNQTQALIYNICMMEYSQSDLGSDDNAADRCGASMQIDSTPIKQCAKGDRGTQLLKYYGEESKKANFKHVPFIFINGVNNDGQNFMRDVCAAFSIPPLPCSNVL